MLRGAFNTICPAYTRTWLQFAATIRGVARKVIVTRRRGPLDLRGALYVIIILGV